VRNYERLAMFLSSIVQRLYIDPIWVAAEYLRRCKNGSWNKENDVDALKCWNLERILDAELLNEPVPSELTMEDFIADGGDEE
jgi:hypothetical protein